MLSLLKYLSGKVQIEGVIVNGWQLIYDKGESITWHLIEKINFLFLK